MGLSGTSGMSVSTANWLPSLTSPIAIPATGALSGTPAAIRDMEPTQTEAWLKTDPQVPKSKWWYRDRFDMGFRLVCDPVDIPEGQ